jgi:hypothetical protein
MAPRPKRSHNGGPPLDDYQGPPWGKGDAYIFLAWQAAHAKAWKAPSRDVMLMRMDKAERLGLTYESIRSNFWNAGDTCRKTISSASPRSSRHESAGVAKTAWFCHAASAGATPDIPASSTAWPRPTIPMTYPLW